MVRRIATRQALILSAIACLLASTVSIPALAQTPEQLCNRLAGDPAVKLEDIDAAAAVKACSAAVAAAQGNAQLAYQYGRALERLGHLDEARTMYTQASEDGLTVATNALHRLDEQSKRTGTPTDAAARQALARRLSGAGALADHVAKTAAREDIDPIAVLAATGAEPAAILDWVRKNTRLIPYAGTLRGASGVLMDRAGSSLDRALLLGDLLSRSGSRVRIARATLTADEAAALRTASFSALGKSEHAKIDRAELLRQAGDDPRIERAAVEQAADRTMKRSAEFDSTVQSLFNRVLPAVANAAGDRSETNQALVAGMDAALRDHFWIQRRVASGWEDLDPDQALQQKHEATATFDLNAVPEDLKHRVVIRLFAEMWTAGKRTEQKLLDKAIFPSELQGKALSLRHTLLPMPAFEQMLKERDPQQAYADALAAAWVVSPELMIGDEPVGDLLYTTDGKVLPATAYTLASLGVEGFANFAKLDAGLKQAFGGDADSSEKPEKSIVSAEWIEIEIDVPNEPKQTQRRAVFDLLGPAARAGEPKPPQIDAAAAARRGRALAANADIYVFGATPSRSWITRVAAAALAASSRQSVELLRRDAKLEDALETEPSTRLQLPLWGWASNRDGNGLIAESPPVGPNVVIYWQQIGPNADRPKSVSTAIDIVANPTFTAGDFKRGVAQGVMDTVVEYALMSDGPPADNVAALFAASAARGEAWQLIEPQQRERVANLGLAADVKARIASDLDAGNIVLAPSAPVATDRGAQAGWWRIDPKTGATLGVGANGMGAALVERGSLHWWIGKGVCAFIGLGFTLAEGHAAAGTAAVTAACLVTGVHAGYAGLVRHAVIDMVLEIFLAAEYGGEPGGGGPHGGEPGGGGPNGGEPNHSGGDPNPPPVCQ